MAETVACKNPVNVCAGNEPVGRSRAVGAPGNLEERSRAIRPLALAKVDFVARHRLAAFGVPAVDRARRLVPVQNRFDSEQAQAQQRSPDGPRSPSGSAIAQPEHLEAAAEAKDTASAPAMREDVGVPALLAHRFKVGDRRLRAGDEDQVAIARNRSPGLDDQYIDVRLGAKRVEVVEVGDARQSRHGDSDCRARLRRFIGEAEDIFSRQARSRGKIGHDPERGPAGALRDLRHSVIENRRIAAEPIDDEAFYAGPLGRFEERMGADQRRDHAATVDVADQGHRHLGRFRETHVGDVAARED